MPVGAPRLLRRSLRGGRGGVGGGWVARAVSALSRPVCEKESGELDIVYIAFLSSPAEK